ncbi:MAG: acetyl-CoA carboxylase biotin carboxyl carrier protein [Caryophanon sp.]|nr:acetyl-CoA carboxylase biotin carboxyl carrier protein [Caryophanon sp.]
MFKIQEIREIIKLVDTSSVDEFVYEVDGAKLKVKKNGVAVDAPVAAPKAAAPAAVAPEAPKAAAPAAVEAPKAPEAPKAEVAADSELHKITSPMVGTFYQASSPDAAAYVQVGDKVGNESIVCIVEAMKLFNEIEAEIEGEIVEILVKDGQLVEFGQPLFLVKAN